MDIYSTRIPDSFRLIKGLFLIVVISAVVGVVLFFTLSIRDTAKVSAGEIFSENAPKQYLAPFEAEIKEMRIQEGGQVKKGDTLIVLHNDAVITEYNNLNKELDLKRRNILVIERKLNNMNSKIGIQKKELSFVDTDVSSRKKSMELEVRAMARQLNALKKQLETSQKRVDKDYKLFRRGAISEREFNEKNKSYLKEKNYFTELESKYFQQKNTLINLENTRSSSIEKKNLDIISSESQQLDLEKTQAETESAVLKLKQQLKASKKEIDKLTIVSEIDGLTSSVYNLRRDINFVSKGQSLVVISPLEEVDFLAKLSINEKEMKDIQVGQKTRLKVDAYNHYQYGVLEGEIIQINKEVIRADKGETNAFYVIANISNQDKRFNLKSGYKVKGEIVLNKIRLYEFAFNRIFKKT